MEKLSSPNSNPSLFHLTPIGQGFSSQNCAIDSSPYSSQASYDLGSQLLRKCRYKTLNHTSVERLLFHKAAFILNAYPRFSRLRQTTQPGFILHTLAADQDILFHEGNGGYVSLQQNAGHLSFLRKTAREIRLPAQVEERIAFALHTSYGTMPEQEHSDDIRLSSLLLHHLTYKQMGWKNLYRWLFTKQHMCLSQDNYEGLRGKFFVHQDNLLRSYPFVTEDSLDRWLEHRPFCNALLQLCIKEKNPNNVQLLNVEAVTHDCWALLSPEEQQQFSSFKGNRNFFEHFIFFTLREYLVSWKQAGCSVPAMEYRRIRPHAIQQYKKRYDYLETLLQAYSNSQPCRIRQPPPFRDSCRLALYAYQAKIPEDHLQQAEAIRNAIFTFFSHIGRPLLNNTEAYQTVKSRVEGILCTSTKDLGLEVPCALLYMILYWGKYIAHNLETPPSTRENFWRRSSFKGIRSAEQRYAELLFVNQICNILSIPSEQLSKVWSQYVALRGNQILSYEEYCLWCRILKGRYDDLPSIGYQLFYINCCAQCISPHYENLSYRSASPLSRRIYHQFFQQNRHALHSLSFQVDKSAGSQYKRIWSNPSLSFPDRIAYILRLPFPTHQLADSTVLEQYGLNCQKDSSGISDLEELNWLIKETVFQIYLRREARKQLLRAFPGGFSLISALYHHVPLEKYRSTDLRM
ncbi:hypothetical protein B5E43_01385 [Flavonifractor sp. An100]|nr:hypothetical protein B5E43_01385 [Flavonifractor sp. An100]